MTRFLASRFVHGVKAAPRGSAARRLIGKWGTWGLAFFALKGVAWLLLPVLGAAYFT